MEMFDMICKPIFTICAVVTTIILIMIKIDTTTMVQLLSEIVNNTGGF